MVRRFFSRSAPHRATPPTLEARTDGEVVEIAVRNNDSVEAVEVKLVAMLASGETSEYERVEVTLDPIGPGERSFTRVPSTRKGVYRVWWFLTWKASNTAQRASGSVNVG